MAARYRVGIIACGIIAQAHLRAYRQIPAVEVVAGADLSPEVRERWTTEHGIPRMYGSAEAMLAEEKLDLVSICTWPPLRPEMTELVCTHGVKGILAEKPMAVDLAGCDRMIAAAERAGTVLIVGHQRRFHNRYVKARELIDSGAIGDVVQITGFEGADLLSNGSHTVDIIRHLLHDAPAEWVIGQIDLRPIDRQDGRLGFQQWTATHTRYGHHIESGVFALIQFQGGARATIEGGVVGRPRRAGGGGWRAIVYGTEGMVEVAGDQLAAGESWVRARVKGEADWISPTVEANNAFQAEIEALIDVIERGGTHPLDGRSARAGHEIMMAIFESARRRARIDLPLQEKGYPLEAIVAAGQA
ncbi:MAG: Gfo/Idh/MocA family oxidoreductase [Chloroflexi bacterium]|nr:Gfo/Idh/MocA family oxidoreductase [Chloroflexota bacterium]